MDKIPFIGGMIPDPESCERRQINTLESVIMEKYRRDPCFHALVYSMAAGLLDANLSVEDLPNAIWLALRFAREEKEREKVKEHV